MLAIRRPAERSLLPVREVYDGARARLGHALREGVVHEQDLGFGVGQRVGDLGGAPSRAEGCDRTVRPRDGQQEFGEAVGVEGEHVDAFTGVHPQVAQCSGESGHPVRLLGEIVPHSRSRTPSFHLLADHHATFKESIISAQEWRLMSPGTLGASPGSTIRWRKPGMPLSATTRQAGCSPVRPGWRSRTTYQCWTVASVVSVRTPQS
jgi:hypothetical protein